MSCQHCTTAASRWTYGGYDANCPDCEIRRLANSARPARESALDRIERESGGTVRAEVLRRIKSEYARIQSLRGAHAR